MPYLMVEVLDTQHLYVEHGTDQSTDPRHRFQKDAAESCPHPVV